MALVVHAPIVIDGVNFSRQSGQTGPHMLFRRGTALYAVLQYQTASGALAVYKSTDEGQTWVEMDAAGSPANAQGALYYTYDDVDGNAISIAYAFGTSIAFIDFSTATDTYGAESNPFSTVGGYLPEVFWKKLDGTPVLGVNKSTAAHYLSTYSAGAWSAIGAPVFTASGSGPFYTGARDSVGTYHTTLTPGPSSTALQYVQITDSLVASAATTIYTAGTLVPNVSRLLIDGVNVRGAALVEDAPAVFKLLAFTGTPLATPAFTTYVASTSGAGESYSFPDTELDKDGTWVVFWTLQSASLDQEMLAGFNGTGFDAPVVFYDAVANPPPNVDALSNFIHTIDAVQFSDGVWVMLTAMETLDLGGTCAGFALITPAAAPPVPTLACPVASTAQIGVPFSTMLLASGGTPPYTFAILS